MTMFGVADSSDNPADDFDEFFNHRPISAAVTLWFIAAEDPESVRRVLAAEPKADRGFGRKYLSQLRPDWPVTPIGDFPLNRSTSVGRGEFYIAAFPGVTVVQTLLDGVQEISSVDAHLHASIPAHTIFAFGRNEKAGYGGYACWQDGKLTRAFSAVHNGVLEDKGLPEPFEGPFWAGEHSTDRGGISLPFDPVELVDAAEDSWMGIGLNTGEVDINVAAFAVDGRRPPRLDEGRSVRRRTHRELAHDAATALGLGAEASYDDYEEHSLEKNQGEEFVQLAQAAAAAGRRVGRGLVRRTRTLGHRINEAIRHSDRG